MINYYDKANVLNKLFVTFSGIATTIYVTDINETPAIDGEQTFTIDENVDDDSVVADEIDIFDEDGNKNINLQILKAHVKNRQSK